ncbi:hypothetical protein V2W30_34340 [Streptomyces sp. Q6]|uniref:Uncharacterized protein n=1 Tax=Streptomyces citrinus TaxID=3118173 RepID=A0ACD5AL13_9ACTN
MFAQAGATAASRTVGSTRTGFDRMLDRPDAPLLAGFWRTAHGDGAG